MIPLIEIDKVVKLMETKKYDYQGLEEGKMGSCCSMDIELYFCRMVKF